MMKIITYTAVAAALSLSALPAHANGWGGKSMKSYNSFNTTASSHNSQSSGLLNVSPSVQLGEISVLNGILNQSPILSGNSILSGNNTGLGLFGTGTGQLNTIIGNGKSRR